ncbi:MAG: hypothetical protein NC338_05370 [Firmicutes bacterium]|nr:hypothetical protein [Bacillota bacterium]MCM1400826.1 hypothetical protein [Bacteroides sp.]MCM1476683.1 hypothetical protein [Bacteroides sp.]
MQANINSLINTCLEIEGLLMLLNSRGGSAPEQIGSLLKAKSKELAEAIEHIQTENSPELELRPVSCELVGLDVPAPIHAGDENPCESLVEDQIADGEAIADAVQMEVTEDADVNPSQDSESKSDEDTPSDDLPVPVMAKKSELPQMVELTVNDKFRFRRELFSNSDVDLNEALIIASQMSSAEEIEDYFYNDLCMDPDNQTVKDFIALLTKRF